MDKYELKRRTKIFAHNCVKFASSFPKTKLGSHIEGQLIRSSTSVAVNCRAVILAHSTASFAAKLSIVIEEVDEYDFWIEFANSLMKEAKELTAIFIASRKTIQSKNNH